MTTTTSTSTSATGSSGFFSSLGNLLTGADGASTAIGAVRTKLDLGLNRERPKLYDPEAAADMVASANKAQGLTSAGTKLSKITGSTYIAAANDPVYGNARNERLPNRVDLQGDIQRAMRSRLAA